jgi:polysaccharide biosynthesis protein VpsM
MIYKKNIIQLILISVLTAMMSLCVYAAETPPTGQSKGEVVPEGQGISSDVFGEKGGRYHPFLLFKEVYTDNLFTTDSNTKDDFITTIAPGIWLAFPANREKLLQLDTNTTSPGGLNLSRVKPETTRRYQTYFLYSPQFVFYSNHSNHDHVNHSAEALFQYNFNSGLSFDLIDIFHDREEIAGNGITDTLYRHQDNLLDFIAYYVTPSGKLKIQFTYSNYDIGYKDDFVGYRDRNDNSFGASIFYKFWPKTSLFTEYNYADIDYDSGISNDSIENRYYGGITWDMTAKTRGTVKLGYANKDFDLATTSDQEDFSVEIQTQHNINPKRALQINGFRKYHESDLSNASSYLATGIDIGLMQRFNAKWSGTLSFLYQRDEYNGFDRDDDFFAISPAIRFEAKEWLIFDLGYSYLNNNSTVSSNDYEVNEAFFKASLSM